MYVITANPQNWQLSTAAVSRNITFHKLKGIRAFSLMDKPFSIGRGNSRVNIKIKSCITLTWRKGQKFSKESAFKIHTNTTLTANQQ